MNDDQKEYYERQVKEGNDVKGIINMKGWKETIVPNIIGARDKIIMLGKRGESSEIFTDDQGRQRVVTKSNPYNPYSAAKALWMIEGIDTVLQLFDSIIATGEQAKSILKKSDTITKL